MAIAGELRVIANLACKASHRHLEEVQSVLQKGVPNLEQEWKEAPEANRTIATSEGLSNAEPPDGGRGKRHQQACSNPAQEMCGLWRAAHKAQGATSKQSLLASDASAGFTPTSCPS